MSRLAPFGIATVFLSASVLLASCAGYQKKTENALAMLEVGSPDASLVEIEKNNSGKDKDLLYFLEKGELLRMKGAYEESKSSWLSADEKIQQWEESVKKDPKKMMGDLGSFVISDTTRRYDGRDYEKVFINVRLALDHIALGDWSSARTEIKKMHEREAIIAEFRSKEVDAAKEKAEKDGLKATSIKELNGYPVESLDDPQVRALKNSYESAFANYLAGFVYESLGEPSLAAAGYRKAIEMRPGDKLLEEALAKLDARKAPLQAPLVSNTRKAPSNPKSASRKKTQTVKEEPAAPQPLPVEMVDTLIVVESGTAPAIRSKTLPIPLPIPSKNGMNLVAVPISWPVLEPVNTLSLPLALSVDGNSMPLTLLTDVNLMARRALSDEMPGIIVRSSTRAIAKAAAQKAVQDNAQSMGAVGSLLSLATTITAVATENADERTWRMLPGTFSIVRMSLPIGTHKIDLGGHSREMQLSGKHAVVSLRTAGPALYVTQSPAMPVIAQTESH